MPSLSPHPATMSSGTKPDVTRQMREHIRQGVALSYHSYLKSSRQKDAFYTCPLSAYMAPITSKFGITVHEVREFYVQNFGNAGERLMPPEP